MRFHLSRISAAVALALALATASCLPEPSVRAGALTTAPRVWERFETVGHVWASFENAFDPDEIRVDGEFVAPSGATIAMPGFATREYQRALVAVSFS